MTDANNADSSNKERTPAPATPSDITVTGKHDAVVLPLKINNVDVPNALPGISSRYRLECGGVGTLSWAEPINKPVKYIVARSVDNQATWVTQTQVNGILQTADIEVLPDVTNFFRVTAWTSDTQKADSSVISIFRDGPLPAPILNRVYVSLSEDRIALPQIYVDWLWPSYDNPQVNDPSHRYLVQTLSVPIAEASQLPIKAASNNNWNLGITARADLGGWSDVLGNKEPYNANKLGPYNVNIPSYAYDFRKYFIVTSEDGSYSTLRLTSIPVDSFTRSQAPAGHVTAVRVAQISNKNSCVGVFSDYLTIVTPDKPVCGQAILLGNADAGCCPGGGVFPRSGTNLFDPFDYLGCKNLCGVRSLQDDTSNAKLAIRYKTEATATSPALNAFQPRDPREYMRYVFNDSYNVLYYDNLFPFFTASVLDGNNQAITPDTQSDPNSAAAKLCGAFVCFRYVPTQSTYGHNGEETDHVLYAEPLIFLPKNHKVIITGTALIKMPITFVASVSADLKYAKDNIQSSSPPGTTSTPEVPYKVTYKIRNKFGGGEQPLKFYTGPGPKILGAPVNYEKTQSETLPECYIKKSVFDGMFKPTGKSMLLYEDAFPSDDYIVAYDAAGNPVANVVAEISANVDASNASNAGPCGIWLKCVGFQAVGDCHGDSVSVEGKLEALTPTRITIPPDPFPELGPRYLTVIYSPQIGDGITYDYRIPSIPRRGPVDVAPNSPGDIGSLGIWVGGQLLRRMGNVDGTETRVVIPITTQTGLVSLNYTDIPGLYWDNAGKWLIEVYFGRDCLRYPLESAWADPQPSPTPIP